MLFPLLRFALLVGLVSLHFVGGAALFRRLAPRESPWLGFVIPFIVFCLACNCIEHFLPLTNLYWLLPLTSMGSIWLILRPGFSWRGLVLPTSIFIGSLTFALAIRALRPAIALDLDGLADANQIMNFLHGETLPPTESWMPPFKDQHYYTMMHYAASVMIRLFHLDIGTGYNVASAILSALLCYLAAATTYRLTRGRLWLTILMPVLILSAATGCTTFIWLTMKDADPGWMSDIINLTDNKDHPSYLVHFLHPVEFWSRRNLTVPGYWTYMGSYHDGVGGQFLVLFAVWCLTELLQRKRSNWPWICLLFLPVLTLNVCTWILPFTAAILLAAFFGAWWSRYRPRSTRTVLFVTAAAVILIIPTLSDFFTISAYMVSQDWSNAEQRTLPGEFLLQWWPVTLLWLSMFFLWTRLPLAVRCLQVILPILFLLVENVTIDFRPIETEKFWGTIYAAAYITFLPMVAIRREWSFRVISCLVIVSTLTTLPYWLKHAWDSAEWGHEILYLQGEGPLRWDSRKNELWYALKPLQNEVILTGRADDEFYENPSLGVFTGNRIYIAWVGRMRVWCDPTSGEQWRRQYSVTALYDGKMPDPLRFLRLRNIAAVVIWPGDNISDAVLDKFKTQLAPAYEYCDYRDGGDENCGVFIYRPQLSTLPPTTNPIIQLPLDSDGHPIPVGQ